jgi:hypothetical protein
MYPYGDPAASCGCVVGCLTFMVMVLIIVVLAAAAVGA